TAVRRSGATPKFASTTSTSSRSSGSDATRRLADARHSWRSRPRAGRRRLERGGAARERRGGGGANLRAQQIGAATDRAAKVRQGAGVSSRRGGNGQGARGRGGGRGPGVHVSSTGRGGGHDGRRPRARAALLPARALPAAAHSTERADPRS